MTRSRVAVVGVGHLGQHHARILSQIPEVELVAVADSRIEQARSVAEKTGTRAVADYRELLNEVDAVSIAVPTFMHREVAGDFLARGIATLVEKPLASSSAEAEELVALAQVRRTLLQVGHVERFNPALSALDGLPMRPKYITAERLSTYTFRSTDIGVVLDLMIHDIDLVLAMNPGPVRSVVAVGVSVFGGHEDVANARIEFEDGCVANLTASRASFQAMRKMRLWSAEGYAMLDFMTKQGTLVRPSEQLRRGQVDLAGVDLTNPAAVKDHLFGTVLRVDQVQSEIQDQLKLELEDFVQAIRSGTPPKVSGQQGLRAMRLASEILRAIQTHQWEGISDGPIGPHHLPQPLAAQNSLLKGPFSWRARSGRSTTSNTSQNQ
ncbi:Gfo/Idh/MocA family oxidoreductase [Singulisphaera sp. Ch08]|uniref:Gfo/Idh/MocA family oxidoreductase n=1 Tax=Singulisphaera sp. Ch08 TaxID=3120278 RepID=A0AAU7CS26_9BACT